MCLKREMNSFCDARRKGKKDKYIIKFHSKENKERKIDFTRTARKDKIQFPCVKLRWRITKKMEEEKWREKSTTLRQRKEKRATDIMKVNIRIHHLPSQE